MRTNVLAVVAGTVSALALVAGHVAAAPPVVVDEGTFDDTFEVPADEFFCDVDVTVNEVGSFRVTDFYDRDGNFVRGRVHVMGTLTVTSAYGQAVDRWAQNDTFDPEDLTVTFTGNPWNTHAGAGGVLVNDSGRIVVDVTTGEAVVVNGPHQAFFGDFDALCEVLEP